MMEDKKPILTNAEQAEEPSTCQDKTAEGNVTDGSVENYDFDWGESAQPEEILLLDQELIDLDEQAGMADNTIMDRLSRS